MEKPRTPSQNKSLHKLFTDVSNHCVSVGLDQKTVVNKLEAYSCPTSPAFVKETWRAMQVAITGKESTTELTSAEINQVYEVFSKFYSELTGESFTFPSYDALAMQALLDDDKIYQIT
jgi:hypothetical protein